jgi:hypothetical protein
MRLFACLSLLLAGGTCRAWDTIPHQKITKAALDSLPARYLNRLGPEVKPLIDIYCMYPDRYQEMVEFGFVRRSPGPRDAAEIEAYCVRPMVKPSTAPPVIGNWMRVRSSTSSNAF